MSFATEIDELVQVLDHAYRSRKAIDEGLRSLKIHIGEARTRAHALAPATSPPDETAARTAFREIERLRSGIARAATMTRDRDTARALRALLKRD